MAHISDLTCAMSCDHKPWLEWGRAPGYDVTKTWMSHVADLCCNMSFALLYSCLSSEAKRKCFNGFSSPGCNISLLHCHCRGTKHDLSLYLSFDKYMTCFSVSVRCQRRQVTSEAFKRMNNTVWCLESGQYYWEMVISNDAQKGDLQGKDDMLPLYATLWKH